MKETELATHFINHFEGFDIYKEVPSSGIIDIVIKSGNITTAIEVKCSLNFDVIEQALNNVTRANYSYIAVPMPKSKSFAYRICKHYGIGVLGLTSSLKVVELVAPKLNRKIIKLKLEQWQKESVAGSQNDRMTAFKNTVRSIHKYVKSQGGKAAIKQVLKNVDTHYSSNTSARGCIVNMIYQGVIKELEYDNGYLIAV